MKFTIVTFCVAALLFVSCNSEEPLSQDDSLNLTRSIDESSAGEENLLCWDTSCVPNYVYPTQLGSHTTYHVIYAPWMSLEEIECKRQQYFNCFNILRMNVIQPSDPYHDYWVVWYGKPHTTITTSLCTDPETGLTIQCN